METITQENHQNIPFRNSSNVSNISDNQLNELSQQFRQIIPKPMIKTHHKQKSHSQKRNLDEQLTFSEFVCSKYNACINTHAQIKGRQQNKVHFEIPQQLLHFNEEEFQQQVEIYPYIPEQNNITHNIDARNQKIEQIDHFIKQQLRQHSRKQKQKVQKQKLDSQNKKQRLLQLNQKTKKLLERDRLKRESLQKQGAVKQIRPAWGHSLFNEQKPNESIQQEQIIKQSPKNFRKIELEPVDKRIKNYQHKKLSKQRQNEEKKACKHKHSNHAKDLVQIDAQIFKDAEQIIMAKRKKQKEEYQKKVIKEAKIRAIQLQSKQSLKKFKKKPVDPTIEFIVDVPTSYSQNKSKKNNKKKVSQKQLQTQEVIEAQKHKKQNVNSNVQKMKEYSEKLRETQKSIASQRSQKSKKGESLREGASHQSIQESREDEQMLKNSRFYIWNVPVYYEDLEKLQENYYPQKQFKKGKLKSFKDEVREYLQEKFHKEQREDIQRDKEEQFKYLVEEKKRQYLRDYDRQNFLKDELADQEQIHWDEDQIYKHMGIANFTKF